MNNAIPRNPDRIVSNRVQPVRSSREGIGIIIFLLAHIPLSLVMRESATVATVQAYLTIVGALGCALFGRRVEIVAYACAYIVGAEVLWRMTGASIPWESGKYLLSAVLVVGMFKFGRLKGGLIPLLYLVLLLPSALLTAEDLKLETARKVLSFNLSGPVALAMSAWFFSQMRIAPSQLRKIFLMVIAPVLGVASIAIFGILTATEIRFTDESNSMLSGGFGPNQVSSILGLGALFAFLIAVDSGSSRSLRVLMFVMMILFAAQSAMTFSRSGLYLAAGSALVASFFLARDARLRFQMIVVSVLLVVVATYVILPRLDTFTQGTISKRFESTSSSGRTEVILTDLEIWAEHPILGIGPGQAKFHRGATVGGFNAHTELSRLVAEHGIFGLAALFLMIAMAYRSYKKAKTARSRAVVASLLAFSFVYMLVNAMRLAAPSFLFGLGTAFLVPEQIINAKVAIKRGFGRNPKPQNYALN